MGFEALPLQSEQKEAIESLIDLGSRLTGSDRPIPADKFDELDLAVLDGQFVDDEAVVAVAVCFGGLIRSMANYEWVWVEDDKFSSQISLARVGYGGVCHPISMIEKRLAHDEILEAFSLAEDTIYTIGESIRNGQCAPCPGTDGSL